MRVFPLSNWTELDVWQYILREQHPGRAAVFRGERPVVERDGALIMVDDERMPLLPGERPQIDAWCASARSAATRSPARSKSEAATLDEIVAEMRVARTSERPGRLIDNDQAASMEKKKREGYF